MQKTGFSPNLRLSGFGALLHGKLTHTFSLYRQWWQDIGAGLLVRIITLAVLLGIGLTYPQSVDQNDMNELVTLGILYMFQGQNPYNRIYVLSTSTNVPQVWYAQDFFNYGPATLFFHLPAMIWPYRYSGAGYMDFSPSFTLLHMGFDFLMFDRLKRMGYRTAALALWANPLGISLDSVTHLSVPLFLVLMGYEKWKDPFQSVFWLGLGAITYQYVLILLLFAVAYHIRTYRKVLLGLLPSLLVIGGFQLWATLEGRPLALFHDLFWVQLHVPYPGWIEQHGIFFIPWMGSIPVIIYNVFGTDFVTDWTGGLLRLSTVMMAFALVVTIVLLVDLLRRRDHKRSLVYGAAAIVLILLANPSGALHHRFIEIFPCWFAGMALFRQYRQEKRKRGAKREQSSE